MWIPQCLCVLDLRKDFVRKPVIHTHREISSTSNTRERDKAVIKLSKTEQHFLLAKKLWEKKKLTQGMVIFVIFPSDTTRKPITTTKSLLSPLKPKICFLGKAAGAGLWVSTQLGHERTAGGAVRGSSRT